MLRPLRLCIITGLFLSLAMSGTSLADLADLTHQVNGNTAQVAAGYRAMSLQGNPQRAREYDSLEAGPTLDLNFQSAQDGRNLSFDGRFLNENDFNLNADLNLHSQLRFLFRTARLFHNLDHIPYVGEEAPQNSFYLDARHDYADSDPGDTYGLRVDETEALLRVKMPDFPAHLNLKYWRWEKKGKQQLRYAVENCATSCHMISKTRPVDRVTEEFSGSVNAHLGFFDLIFEQIVRTFREKSATPYDVLDSHYLRAAGSYQHDENPDATFTQSTVKAQTNLGGGFVANASFSLGKRENESDLFDVAPIKAKTDFRKLASDITYSPSANWTMNFRYRLLDIDQSNNDRITASGAVIPFTFPPASRSFDVRDNPDITRAFYEASVAFRPTSKTTIKGDYRREEIHRSDTGGPVAFSGFTTIGGVVPIDPYWELPENETIQRYRLSYTARHLQKNALKLHAWYQYQTSDDPAYNISVEKGHTAFASATYRPGTLWGTTASLKVQKNSNDGFQHAQFSGGLPVYFSQDRKQEQQNASLGFWLNPVEALSFDLNYGFLRSHITQDLLFGNGPPYTIPDDAVDYRQTVHTVTLGTTWQATEALSCRLEGYHLRSNASYSPNFPATAVVNANSDDLHDISKIEMLQNGLRGRVDWRVNQQLTAGLEASFDDYDDRNSNVFDGSAQTCLASLSYRW